LAQQLRECSFVLREARDLLLPRLVSGEIDVTDLDIDAPELAA
jgi:type I restriction enzyme S subunit